jgi:hypothetical protein
MTPSIDLQKRLQQTTPSVSWALFDGVKVLEFVPRTKRNATL